MRLLLAVLAGLICLGTSDALIAGPVENNADIIFAATKNSNEKWTLETIEGHSYLKASKDDLNGENRFIIFCNVNRLMGIALVTPPDASAVNIFPHSVGIFIDGDLKTLPNDLITHQPHMDKKFAAATFFIESKMANAILRARSTGVGMQPPNKDIFYGFEINAAAGKANLAKIISECPR